MAMLAGLSVAQAKTINVPTCSQDDFEHAYYVDSVPGDTIVLPAGSATWGNSSRANAGVIFITTDVTVVGQGDSTVITLDDTGGTFSNGVIALWSAATFKKLKIIGSSAAPVTAFQINPFNSFTGGFRLTDITYVGGTADAYFAVVNAGVTSGLIDNCRITGNTGSAELIFVRGPSDAWTTNDTLGKSDNIFIENCTFSGQGYVCDANSNARVVVRFCTINGQNKIDGHGLASNSPAVSVRQVEAYGNVWNTTGGVWTAIEVRGGTAMLFDNTAAATGSNAFFFLTDYGYQAQWPNFGNVYQTPTNYPITHQVGRGKSGTSQPAYVFNNIKNSAAWPRSFESAQVLNMTSSATGFPVGTTNIGVSPIGINLNAGNAIAIAGDSNRYLLASTAFVPSQNLIINSPGLQSAIPASATAVTGGAVTLYQQQTSNPSATFTESDIIKSNRDFFADAGFDTATGVSRGTTADMNALPTGSLTAGYGFWVTDQGSWNASAPGTSGLLYAWSGSAWVLKYTPYTYPHPLRTPRAPSNLQLGP